jgi:hypothetical protein
LREDHAAGAVLGVLDLDERRRRIQAVALRLDRGEKLLQGKEARGSDLGELHAGVGGGAAGLVP